MLKPGAASHKTCIQSLSLTGPMREPQSPLLLSAVFDGITKVTFTFVATTPVMTRMKALFSDLRTSVLAKFVLGAVTVLLLTLSYVHWTSAGLRELDLALPLVANAHSWHLTHTTGPLKFEEDVICPFDYDATTTVGEQSTREVHVGHMYYAQRATGEWNTQAGNEFGHCSGGPQINHMGLALDLRAIRESGRISRGPLKLVGGHACRIWNLLNPMPASGGPEQVATLCIDAGNHFPLELASSQETYEFSNWNHVSAIQPPQIESGTGQGAAPADYSAVAPDSQ